ncbi:uncharacterized protein [Drosophila pseudoobscura]|uniref:MADF domain-containing protein n=1 Tax=Drosophila pseudoobscura pseudoobscura TaxID=46245 RepID=A0A6I8VNI7_DROPS|nr:uncharacterized protein LOC117183308 [Drosophila pseudoobscura]
MEDYMASMSPPSPSSSTLSLQSDDDMSSEYRSSLLTRSQRFNLKLLVLYSKHKCLWNFNHVDFFNTAMHKSIWADIVRQLDTKRTITWQFCRRRIMELRHYKNQYRLQQLRLDSNLPNEWYHVRDVPMSLPLDGTRGLELLPKESYKHCFYFLNSLEAPSFSPAKL